MDKPLAGVRVLDFSKVLAGPLCTQYLADMGAEVIKVETVDGGDDTRAWPPFSGPGLGATFLSANRGKRSIALDLKSETGRQVALRLARKADVAIESFGTGVAERLGIDEAALRAENSDIIYCSISGFGRSGPMRAAPGYDAILQAFCGVMALSGEEGGDYVRSPVSPIDQSTGMHALSGILAALYARRGGAPGRRVEASLYETALGLLAYNIHSFWERGVQPARCGSSHEALCPYQAFEASDGPVFIGVANDRLWRRLCAVAGLEDMAEDPRYAANPDRAARRAEVIARVQAAVAQRPVAYWNEELAKAKVPCAPINGLREVLEHPQTAAINIILEYDQPGAGPQKCVAQPVRFDGETRRVERPAPRHGEHGAEILGELGYSGAEIEALAAEGALRLSDA